MPISMDVWSETGDVSEVLRNWVGLLDYERFLLP